MPRPKTPQDLSPELLLQTIKHAADEWMRVNSSPAALRRHIENTLEVHKRETIRSLLGIESRYNGGLQPSGPIRDILEEKIKAICTDIVLELLDSPETALTSEEREKLCDSVKERYTEAIRQNLYKEVDDRAKKDVLAILEKAGLTFRELSMRTLERPNPVPVRLPTRYFDGAVIDSATVFAMISINGDGSFSEAVDSPDRDAMWFLVQVVTPLCQAKDLPPLKGREAEHKAHDYGRTTAFIVTNGEAWQPAFVAY